MAAALVAGAALSPVVISSPAQAAGSPVYTAGYWFWKSDCDAARAEQAKDRTLKVSSCKSGFGPSGIPGYYFTYQSAY